MRKGLLLLFILSISFIKVFAQIDTTSYTKEREEIRSIIHFQTKKRDEKLKCDDIVAVGPKGDISFSNEQWKDTQSKIHLTFKSLKSIPRHEVIRIYNGTTAVVNWLADVNLDVAGHDIKLKVRRLEVYVKKEAGWCMVAGQGTQVDEKMWPINQ